MADEPLVRKTVSIPSEAWKAGERNAKKRGFRGSFSAYVTWLIERDNQGGVEREEVAPEDKGK